MLSVVLLTVTFVVTNVVGYHDPDLNYHLSQVQKLPDCNTAGYSYPRPAVQLTTSGFKVAAPSILAQSFLPQAPAYQYTKSAGYSSGAGLAYQSAALNTYSAPAVTYNSVASHSYLPPAQAYSTQIQAQKEIHGYATSAGLSSVASDSKTVTPLATYAQAPIIAKITAAPLVAKFALSPSKTSYVTQNLVSQQGAYSAGSYAKASLNSYNTHSGPVVTQVYAAPAVSSYATSPALKVQQVHQAQVVSPLRYTAVKSSGIQYSPAPISSLTPVAHVPGAFRAPIQQYASSVHVSAPSVQYAAPTVNQHAAQVVSQYTHHFTPVVNQYAAPVAQYASPAAHYAAPVTQYASPAVSHSYAAPAVSHRYSAPAVSHSYATPAVSHSYATPAVSRSYASPLVSQYAAHGATSVAHATGPVAVTAHAAKVAVPAVAKNVHTDFLNNYDAHPRYSYEYAVNDPHTGDIKQQKEERDGEVVKGQYSLVEPDGSVRTVEYVADWETGFHANVRNSKDHKH